MWIGQSDSFADPAVDTLIIHTLMLKKHITCIVWQGLITSVMVDFHLLDLF